MRKQIYEAQPSRSIDFLGIGRTRCNNLRLYIFLRSRSCRETAILNRFIRSRSAGSKSLNVQQETVVRWPGDSWRASSADRNLPGYSRITGWQHCRITHFAAVSPLPFRGSAAMRRSGDAILAAMSKLSLAQACGSVLVSSLRLSRGKSVPKLNRYVSQCRDVLLDVSHAIPQPMSGWVQQSIAKSG